jgi:hypothetical protein
MLFSLKSIAFVIYPHTEQRHNKSGKTNPSKEPFLLPPSVTIAELTMFERVESIASVHFTLSRRTKKRRIVLLITLVEAQ